MAYIKFQNGSSVALTKSYMTVGSGAGYDISVDGENGILFSLQSDGAETFLLPGERKVLVNGRAIKKNISLNECDRIEVGNLTAVFLKGATSERKKSESASTAALRVLQECVRSEFPTGLLDHPLSYFVDISGAEGGVLLLEKEDSSGWFVVAHHGTGYSKSDQKSLISHTVLEEAIRTREPVYIESIIGHPWEEKASIIESEVFSLACVPLVGAGSSVFGALFLFTKTIGRSISPSSLEVLKNIAPLLSYLVSTRRELSQTKKKAREPIGMRDSALVFDRNHSPMTSIDERISKFAPSPLSILIRGETGTGKEVVAKELHERSERKKGPFVAINCAAIPPTLIESILFGHKRGAFTGADADRTGKFVQANKGTLFLDEIGDLPLDLQAKLLRAIQERVVEPIGSDKGVPFDVRIISATHQDLESLVQTGKFRKDLFYRLNGATMVIPNLRSRGKTDIELLANFFLMKHSENARFSAEALGKLCSHTWPGNVRELEQVVERAVVLSNGSEISAADVELGPDWDSEDAEQTPSSLKEMQDRSTRLFLQKVLKECGGNREKAAEKLSISKRTLYRILADEKSGIPE